MMYLSNQSPGSASFMYRYNTYTDLTFPSGLHNHCEIIIVSQGEMTVMANSEPIVLKEGEGVFLPSYVIHSFLTRTHSQCHIWEYDSTFIREDLSSNIRTFKYPAKSIELFNEHRNAADVYMNRSEIYFIASCVCFGQAKLYAIKSNDVIGKTCYYIAEHFREEVTLKDAAAYAGVSPAYLSRTFKSNIGLPFSSCLASTRVDCAMNLLKYGSASVTEIAALCGFGTLRNFNRFFKRIVGCTPSEYRKNQ